MDVLNLLILYAKPRNGAFSACALRVLYALFEGKSRTKELRETLPNLKLQFRKSELSLMKIGTACFVFLFTIV